MAQIRRLGASSWISGVAMMQAAIRGWPLSNTQTKSLDTPKRLAAGIVNVERTTGSPAPPLTWPPPLVVARHGCHALQRPRSPSPH
jgi:hypothetical protein